MAGWAVTLRLAKPACLSLSVGESLSVSPSCLASCLPASLPCPHLVKVARVLLIEASECRLQLFRVETGLDPPRLPSKEGGYTAAAVQRATAVTAALAPRKLGSIANSVAPVRCISRHCHDPTLSIRKAPSARLPERAERQGPPRNNACVAAPQRRPGGPAAPAVRRCVWTDQQGRSRGPGRITRAGPGAARVARRDALLAAAARPRTRQGPVPSPPLWPVQQRPPGPAGP